MPGIASTTATRITGPVRIALAAALALMAGVLAVILELLVLWDILPRGEPLLLPAFFFFTRYCPTSIALALTGGIVMNHVLIKRKQIGVRVYGLVGAVTGGIAATAPGLIWPDIYILLGSMMLIFMLCTGVIAGALAGITFRAVIAIRNPVFSTVGTTEPQTG